MFARALYVYQAEHSSRLKCRQVPVTAGRARTTSPARTSSPPGCTRARPGAPLPPTHNPRPTTRTRLNPRHWLRTCAEASRMRSGSQLTARRKRETHETRGLARGGGSRRPRIRARARPAAAPWAAAARARLRRLLHRLQPASSPPRPELDACRPEHAVDLLPTHRRAAPRVDPAEPIAAVMPRAAHRARAAALEEEAGRLHHVPPPCAREPRPGMAALRQLHSKLLRAPPPLLSSPPLHPSFSPR